MNEGSAVVFGATSSIVRHAALELVRRGWRVCLCGRDLEELERIAGDMRVRTGAEVIVEEFHADKVDVFPTFWAHLKETMPDLRGVLIGFGEMGSVEQGFASPEHVQEVLTVNFNAPAAICMLAANDFAEQRYGWIAAIGSVAGDRGRQGNFLYGSAKGALALLLQGLRARLNNSNVRVITIKPGFVDTPMTFGKKGVFLAAHPKTVGKKIVAAVYGHKEVLYIPGIWKYIMAIVRAIPEPIFKRMKF